VPADYDPTDRDTVYAYLRERQGAGELPTGLLYIEEAENEMHQVARTVQTPLFRLPFEELCPGRAVLGEIQARFR
jgi:2-oxoglutarate ferredoxin oxidoreductase subunit beta